MAEVTVNRAVAEQGRLPRFCLRCGAASAWMVRKKFTHRPGWTWWLMFLGPIGSLLSLQFKHRSYCWSPLCDEHRHHWRWRAWLCWGGLAGLLVLFVLVDGTGFSVPDGLVVAVPVGWLLGSICLQLTSIRATDMTDYTITLTGVAPEFVLAVQEQREFGRSSALGNSSGRLADQAGSEQFFDPQA